MMQAANRGADRVGGDPDRANGIRSALERPIPCFAEPAGTMANKAIKDFQAGLVEPVDELQRTRLER